MRDPLLSEGLLQRNVARPSVSPRLRRWAVPKTTGLRTYETADYTNQESDVFFAHLATLTPSQITMKRRVRWVLVCVIGLMTGLTVFTVDYATSTVTDFKYRLTLDKLDSGELPSKLGAFGILAAINMTLALVASALVSFVEPVAAGSGIPEVKCYLNGNKVPRVLRFKTLFVKAVGVSLAVSAGLACGKEGPMIACGSVIAAGLSQGKSKKFSLPWRVFEDFRNDREKRDFVAGGAAAGVAAAFGAPVGGILFALEEGASFWDQSLIFRAFFCSSMSAWVVDIMLSGVNSNLWGHLDMASVLNFGNFDGQGSTGRYSLRQVPLFIVLGLIGGLIGAVFVHLNLRLATWRKRCIPNVKGSYRRVAEAVMITAFTTIVMFCLPLIYQRCHPITEELANKEVRENLRVLGCPEGEFGDMSTLAHNRLETVIKILFHADSYFSAGALLLAAAAVLTTTTVTYGMAVPSGLFVPALVAGALYGRAFGMAVGTFMDDVIPGTFALIGAAASLGGMVRMNLSVTVILIETTNDLTWLLPIMITILVSKWTGDFFNESIYDEYIHLNKIPFLEWNASHDYYLHKADEVMNRSLISLGSVDRVGRILEVLTRNTHNGYPVVDVGNKKFVGLVLREELTVILSHPELFFTRGGPQPPSLTHRELTCDYPWFPKVNDVAPKLTPDQLNLLVDISPYVNKAPAIVQPSTSLSQCFAIFRSRGLRHMVVLNEHHEIAGMITRYDLLKIDHIEEANDSPAAPGAAGQASSVIPVSRPTVVNERVVNSLPMAAPLTSVHDREKGAGVGQ
jgi:chloride channel 7